MIKKLLCVKYTLVSLPLFDVSQFNNNNNNNDTTIYKAPKHVHEVTTRAPYTRFTRWMQNSARRPPTLGPSRETWFYAGVTVYSLTIFTTF